MNSPHNSLATILDIQGVQPPAPQAGEEGDGAILMSCECSLLLQGDVDHIDGPFFLDIHAAVEL